MDRYFLLLIDDPFLLFLLAKPTPSNIINSFLVNFKGYCIGSIIKHCQSVEKERQTDKNFRNKSFMIWQREQEISLFSVILDKFSIKKRMRHMKMTFQGIKNKNRLKKINEKTSFIYFWTEDFHFFSASCQLSYSINNDNGLVWYISYSILQISA